MDVSTVERTMRDAAQAIAPDRWSLSTTADAEVEREGWTVSLASTSGRGAGISVHVTQPPTTIDVVLGEGGFTRTTRPEHRRYEPY